MTPNTNLLPGTLRISRLGVGAMTWGEARGLARLHPAKIIYGGADGREAEQAALEISLAAGVNLFDTAAMYSGGASERRLGELACGRDLVIATKFPSSYRGTTESMPRDLDTSLARLGRIDLYQHHFPSSRVSIPRLMDLMADALETGKIKAIGVSNYSAEQMREAHAVLARRGISLTSNQVEYSLLHREPEANGVLDACRELGVILIAYMPLAGGALTGKYKPGVRISGMRRMMPHFRRSGLAALSPVVALLESIGERYGKTPAQVALRWLIEKEIVVPIPGAKNAKQAAANAGALSFALSEDEMDALDRATRA